MSYEFSEDELPSDRIEEVMAMSLAVRGNENAVAGPSQPKRRAAPAHSRSRVEPIDELSIIEAELDEVDEEISRLRKLRDSLLARKQYIIQRQPIASAVSAPTANGKGKAKNGDINYFTEFPWSLGLKAKMKEVFKIDNFRLCQEAVCNANMDMRDIVCVMPTGGGKSLTYQLPALLTPGCTLVISPLISLMSDQLFHLKEAGVEAVMITSETSPGENKAMESRLAAMVSGNTTGQPGIKLCYVTPERIAKNKLFRTLLGKLADVRKLARIVIDEAHCVSQMGHDFRTDYLKLDVLRKLFPSVPIMALSATCPPSVLRDLLNTLGMPPIVDGRAASKKGTVYFSAPLYRANLHYSVVSKPATAKSHLKMMQNYILDNHKGHSGIIYCLTPKRPRTSRSSCRP
ncbi:P-loop containing nucleoside triphosphate hydrolase protein [Amylocystis lapponica]|nr:P-loop containing nucleoside triphosphate hydrolase protein [Amylocystis lapponica]